MTWLALTWMMPPEMRIRRSPSLTVRMMISQGSSNEIKLWCCGRISNGPVALSALMLLAIAVVVILEWRVHMDAHAAFLGACLIIGDGSLLFNFQSFEVCCRACASSMTFCSSTPDGLVAHTTISSMLFRVSSRLKKSPGTPVCLVMTFMFWVKLAISFLALA